VVRSVPTHFGPGTKCPDTLDPHFVVQASKVSWVRSVLGPTPKLGSKVQVWLGYGTAAAQSGL